MINPRKKLDILARDGFRCVYCGQRSTLGNQLTLDHKTPKSRGGSNHGKNLDATCRRCNLLKGQMTKGEFKIWMRQIQKDIEFISTQRVLRVIALTAWTPWWKRIWVRRRSAK